MRRLLYRGKWVIGTFVLAGVVALTYLWAHDAWRGAQTNAIYATALRHWCAEYRDPEQLAREGLYVLVDGKDPDAELLRDLRASIPAVRQGSEWADPPGTGVRVWLEDLTRVGLSAAEVTIGLTSTWNMASGMHYRLRHTLGGWEVLTATPFAHLVLRDDVPAR